MLCKAFLVVRCNKFKMDNRWQIKVIKNIIYYLLLMEPAKDSDMTPLARIICNTN